MRIDDGRYGVGGVMKSVHEFKPEGDQQRRPQQEIRPSAAQGDIAEVSRDVEADVRQAADEGDQHDDPAQPGGRFLHLLVE